MSKIQKVTIGLSSIALILTLSSCASFVEGFEEGFREGSNSSEEQSQTENPSQTEEKTSGGTALTEEELTLASSFIEPHKAVAGRYILVEGYEFFDTLTVLELEGGEKVYFVTDHGHPFGNIEAGLTIAADQYTRELTGFGEAVPEEGPAGLDAAKILKDHKKELG